MKAIAIDKFGERGSLHEFAPGTPQATEAQVNVTVAGVNPFDWMLRDGMAGDRTMPLVLGLDFAGTIEHAGNKADSFKPGDRVFGIASTHGSYAQTTIVATDKTGEIIGKMPARITDAQAAALPTPGLTALACIEKLAVIKDSTLVINGAAGSVGSIALQVAVGRGVHVIAIVKGAPGETKNYGAEAVIDAEGIDIIAGIARFRPDGVDAVLDLVSSTNAAAMRFADVMRPGGAIVSTKDAVDIEAFTDRGFAATNIDLFTTPQATRESLEELGAMVAAGSIVLKIGQERSLEDAADVLDETKSGKLEGKTVLRIA